MAAPELPDEKVRHRIFLATIALTFAAPLLIVILPHLLIAPQPRSMQAASYVCSSSSLITLYWYSKTRQVGMYTLILTGVILTCYSVALTVTGGLHSPICAFIPIFPLASGLLAGKRGTTAASVYLLGLVAGLLVADLLGWLPPAPLHTPTILLAVEYVIAIGLTSSLVYLFQLLHIRDRTAFRDTKDQLQRLIDGIPAFISHWDRNELNLVSNSIYCSYFGKTPAEILGSHYKNLIGPIYEKIEGPIRRILDGQSGTETLLTQPDQKGSWYQVTIKPDTIDGKVVGFFTIAVDITESRRTEAKLRESENFLRVVLDSINQGVWALNSEGVVSTINRAALAELGYSDPAELIGQKMHARVHHTHPDGTPHEKHLCPMHDTFTTGRTHYIPDDVLWRKDGTSFPVSYSSAPLLLQDQLIGSVVTFEDKTESVKLKKQVELEQQKILLQSRLASLGELAAGIAHEVNNPLAIIVGSANQLTQFAENPKKLAEKIESIIKSSKRISKIIGGLKKFSRSEEKPVFVDHPLRDILKEALILTELKFRREDVTLMAECETDARIRCNVIEVEQVLVNLINNAIDAAKGLPEHWVKLTAHEHGEFVVLRVTDSGKGIPKSLREKLFQPFFTTKPVGEGTGLGLSITKGILDEHHATIELIEGAPNTCFEVRFPVVQRSKNVT
jgi:PAS domain S-box-containing protein